LTTADFRKNLKLTVFVQNQTIVANIVLSKSYPRNLLVAFIFSNYHFYVQNCHFRALFCRFTANQAEIRKTTTKVICKTHLASYNPKMTFMAFLQKKRFIKTLEKHPFLGHSTRLRAPETKIEKNRTKALKFRHLPGFS
jgi:hypothetical protein